MDLAICSALGYNSKDKATGKEIPKKLVVYDVACQYKKKFEDRYNASTILQQLFCGVILGILWAIGKFHLGVHIAECYPPHSLNHIVGAGQISGENLESLWHLLNGFSKMARVMSLGHRAEFLSSSMNAIN